MDAGLDPAPKLILDQVLDRQRTFRVIAQILVVALPLDLDQGALRKHRMQALRVMGPNEIIPGTMQKKNRESDL